MKVTSTKLSNPDWEKLQQRCNEAGITIAEHLRDLIQADLRADTQSEIEHRDEFEVNESTHKTNSSLSRLFGKTRSRPEIADSQTEFERMQVLLKKQATTIETISAQMEGIGEKVEEQVRQQVQQLSQQRSTCDPKLNSMFSDCSRKLSCYNIKCQ